MSEACNELCKIFYVLIDKKGINVISQLETCVLLSKGHKSCGPFGLNYYTSSNGPVLCRFKDLKMSTPLIVELQLGRALIHAQFFNGVETFENVDAQKHLFEFLLVHKKQENIKRRQNVATSSMASKSLSLFQKAFNYQPT